MDNLEIAKALFGNKAAQPNGNQTTTVYGIATSDSVNGSVRVNLGGDTVSMDDDQTIEVDTTFAVFEGDEVIVSLVGADGTGKAPCVIGVVGRGDQQQTEINSVINYVWNDNAGLHVSTAERSVQGANILLDSDSLDIRNGNSNSESDQTVYASFGKEVTVGSRASGSTVGQYSQVFGQDCSASGQYATAIGYQNTSAGAYSLAEGANNTATSHSSYAHVEGNNNTVSQPYAHAEGRLNSVGGAHSHAEGFQNTVSTYYEYSHVEGAYNTVNATTSHVEGSFNTVNDPSAGVEAVSHAEGVSNVVTGKCSHAEGDQNIINANIAHAEGYNCVVNSNKQHVQGQYNVADANATYSDIIGNGSSDNARSNAYNMDWHGNAEFQGEVYVGGCTPNGETPQPVVRYNTINSQSEYYDGSAWAQVPGGGGGGGLTELWTNPNPTSNFAAQTVPLDLSAWNVLCVTYTTATGQSRYASTIVFKDGNSYYVTVGIPSTSNNYYYKRGAGATDSGVTFTNGYQNTTAGAGYAIPQKIYGVC